MITMHDENAEPKAPVSGRWSAEKARSWYKKVGQIRGCNYLPRTAVNSTEMWQADTFDPKTIDEELDWAASAGFNSLRVFLQYIVWLDNPEGLKKRIDQFLNLADKHGFSTMFILFDDCAFSGKQPYLGKQDDPVPGVHNSGWTPSPGFALVEDRKRWPQLEQYVKDVIGTFGTDERVVVWDLYNEPGNSDMGEKSLPLVEATFRWAREVDPTQPLTTGIWSEPKSTMSMRIVELSDVSSFHGYDRPDSGELRTKIAVCRADGRPVLCTEWLHRQSGNTFENILPLFAEENIGWYIWGCVAGKTQTYMHWGSEKGTAVPKVWQHDMFHPDGTPYDPEELELIKRFAETGQDS